MEFYGRQDILDLLNKRATALGKGYRQNIAIIGEESIGKTCLIQHWLSNYYNNYIVPVYLEADFKTFSEFGRKFTGTLLFSFLKNRQAALNEDLNALIEKSAAYIPETVKLIKRILSLKNKKSPENFSLLLELSESFYQETSKRCIIILDEFHNLENLRIKDMYNLWRKQICLSKNTMYVLISSRKYLAHKIFTGDLNLLFGNFEKIELGAFDNKTAYAIVQEKLKILTASSQLSDIIINFSFSHPFYLNAIACAFKDYLHKEAVSKPGIGSLISSLEDMFIDNWGAFSLRFLRLINKINAEIKDPASIRILQQMAKGANCLSKISSLSGKSKKETAAILNQLYHYDFISKNSDIYVLNDKVFGFWLKTIYTHKANSFNISTQSLKEIFRKEIEAHFNLFLYAQNKAVSERVLELFNQFSNELVSVHKKRVRLNRFKEVKLINLGGKQMKKGILARTASSIWITGLKEDKASEEDIRDFASLCKKFKHPKSQKRIFIALGDMEDNANLIAKEEKISAWDASALNTLLDIYDKPRITNKSLP